MVCTLIFFKLCMDVENVHRFNSLFLVRVHRNLRRLKFFKWQWIISNCCMQWVQKVNGLLITNNFFCIFAKFFVKTEMWWFYLEGYFDARALAVDYRTLGFRECVGEVVRYLSSLEGADSSDPIGARLVSHLSQCASELDPLHQSPAALPFPPWPWGSFPQLSASSSPASASHFPPTNRRDLSPHAASPLLAYPSPTLCLAPVGHQGVLLSPALSPVHRMSSVSSHPHRLAQASTENSAVPSPLHSVPPRSHNSSSPSSNSTSSSPSSSSSGHPQVSFRPFVALRSPAPLIRVSKSAHTWGTEIGAF